MFICVAALLDPNSTHKTFASLSQTKPPHEREGALKVPHLVKELLETDCC